MGDFDQWLHRQYIRPQGKIQAMSERDRPFLSMIKKVTNRGGSDFNTPAYVSTPRGWGNTRAQAQAISGTATGNGQYGTWQSTPGNYSGDVLFSDREVSASDGMSDSGFAAFAEAQKTKVEGLFESFGGIMSRLMLGPSGGYVFTCTESTGVLTLTSTFAERVADIEVGDQLVASANDGSDTGHALLGSGSIGFVIEVNRDGSTPTVTVSATDGGVAGTPASWTGTMFIFRVGEFKGCIDRGPNPASSTLVIDSIQSWLPATADTGTFKGVDRSLDTRLSGVRQTATDVAALNIEETLEELATKGRSRFGWKGAKKIFVHTTRFKELSRSLETRRLRGGDTSNYKSSMASGGGKEAYASFSYNTIELMAQGGAYTICDEPHMPQDLAIAMSPEDWEIRCYEEFPSVLDKDSNEILRKTTTDDYSLRAKVYASFMLSAKGMVSHSGRTALPDAA